MSIVEVIMWDEMIKIWIDYFCLSFFLWKLLVPWFFLGLSQKFFQLSRAVVLRITSFLIDQISDVDGINSIWINRNEEATDSESHQANNYQDDCWILDWFSVGFDALDDDVDDQHGQEGYSQADKESKDLNR